MPEDASIAARMVILENRLLEAEKQLADIDIKDIQCQLARANEPKYWGGHQESDFWHPFKGTISSDGTKIEIGTGHAIVGVTVLLDHQLPDINASEYADGEHEFSFGVEVNANTGLNPVFNITTAETRFHLGTGTIETIDGIQQFTSWRQRLFSDIYVPVVQDVSIFPDGDDGLRVEYSDYKTSWKTAYVA